MHSLCREKLQLCTKVSCFTPIGQSRGNGLYWIDPNGGSTEDSFQAFCDMTTDSGGWTLVASKVSPNFAFIQPTFSSWAAAARSENAGSRIHPDMGDWVEVMFRFSDVNNIRVVYNRKAGARGVGNQEFENFLMGHSYQTIKDVHGFYKFSPADGDQRTPSVGFATIVSLHYYSDRMISESHSGTDKWLNMWRDPDASSGYVISDSSQAAGTKCIAGYCYLNKPIWIMVR